MSLYEYAFAWISFFVVFPCLLMFVNIIDAPVSSPSIRTRSHSTVIHMHPDMHSHKHALYTAMGQGDLCSELVAAVTCTRGETFLVIFLLCFFRLLKSFLWHV